jgi:hypothetical protein
MAVVVFVLPPPPHAATTPATTIDENNTFADAVKRERVVSTDLFADTFIRIPKYKNVATSDGRTKIGFAAPRDDAHPPPLAIPTTAHRPSRPNE